MGETGIGNESRQRTGEDRGRIVVGVDGSSSSLAALEWGARQAELTGARLDAVTSWEWPQTWGWAPPYPQEYNPAEDAQHMLDDAVSKIVAGHPSITVETVLTEGPPALSLIRASEGADLLVVGSRGHGEFAGMLLGSVSEHCSTNARCPVLIVRDGD